MKEEEVF